MPPPPPAQSACFPAPKSDNVYRKGGFSAAGNHFGLLASCQCACCSAWCFQFYTVSWLPSILTVIVGYLGYHLLGSGSVEKVQQAAFWCNAEKPEGPLGPWAHFPTPAFSHLHARLFCLTFRLMTNHSELRRRLHSGIMINHSLSTVA